jgi:hypothetical protein
METKPYNLQSPEQIAKDYGGNKQKIAEAMQMGILDPTAGTMAGMFIDRMRSAAQQEAAPQQTIAQQVMAPQPQMPMGAPPVPPGAGAMPPAPPAGLGATPEAAAMAPQMPPMGAPPAQGGPGMAMGGMVPPYASGGGLSDMPLPDGMFDEPSNGGYGDGYAGGGIIAFATGDEVDDEIVVDGQLDPESIYGYYKDPELNRTEVIDRLYKPQTKYSDQINKFYENIMDPQAQKKRRKEDMWMTLGQIGARMAQSPGSIFQAAAAGIGEALPGAKEAAKERRAEQRDAIKTLAQQEGFNNKQSLELANAAIGMSGKYGEFRESDLSRKQQKFLEMFKEEQANKRNAANIAGGIQQSNISAGATRFSATAGSQREILAATREAGRYFDSLTEESPVLKRQKQVDPLGYTKAKMQYVRDYVYGPQ